MRSRRRNEGAIRALPPCALGADSAVTQKWCCNVRRAFGYYEDRHGARGCNTPSARISTPPPTRYRCRRPLWAASGRVLDTPQGPRCSLWGICGCFPPFISFSSLHGPDEALIITGNAPGRKTFLVIFSVFQSLMRKPDAALETTRRKFHHASVA